MILGQLYNNCYIPYLEYKNVMTLKNGFFFCNYHYPHSQVSQNSDVYDLNNKIIILNNYSFKIFYPSNPDLQKIQKQMFTNFPLLSKQMDLIFGSESNPNIISVYRYFKFYYTVLVSRNSIVDCFHDWFS